MRKIIRPISEKQILKEILRRMEPFDGADWEKMASGFSFWISFANFSAEALDGLHLYIHKLTLAGNIEINLRDREITVFSKTFPDNNNVFALIYEKLENYFHKADEIKRSMILNKFLNR